MKRKIKISDLKALAVGTKVLIDKNGGDPIETEIFHFDVPIGKFITLKYKSGDIMKGEGFIIFDSGDDNKYNLYLID